MKKNKNLKISRLENFITLINAEFENFQNMRNIKYLNVSKFTKIYY